MRKLWVDMYLLGQGMLQRIKDEVQQTKEEERGDIGIKQLAITVGVIILVGAAVIALKTNIGTMLEDVWEWLFKDVIQKIGA